MDHTRTAFLYQQSSQRCDGDGIVAQRDDNIPKTKPRRRSVNVNSVEGESFGTTHNAQLQGTIENDIMLFVFDNTRSKNMNEIFGQDMTTHKAESRSSSSVHNNVEQ